MKNNDFNLILNFIKGIASTFKGVFTVFCQALKKRVTLSYPEEKSQIADKFRGKLECDYKKCIGCGLCAKICPAINVLTVKEDEDGFKKLAKIDISRCIFCGNCVYNCPKNALNMTKQYELATNDKKVLLLDCKKISEIKIQEKPENQTELKDSKEDIKKEPQITSLNVESVKGSKNTHIPEFVTEEDI